MPLTPLSGALGLKRAAHLLRRATFGASKLQIDHFAGLTAQQAIAQLFTTDLPDPPLPLDPATGQEWVASGTTDANSGDDELRDYFKAWCIGQMMSTDISESQELAYALREKITLFFHTHFTTMEEKVKDSRALYFQNELFRIFSFDGIDREVVMLNQDTGMMESLTAPTNFKELTKKICVDNAMLIFLDGRQNVKGSVNENFAREMFELFTIGRGLEARVNGMVPPEAGDYFTFKEQDVKEAAKVISGFDTDEHYQNIDQETGLPRGIIKGTTIATQHTEGVKEFSSYFHAHNNGKVVPDTTLMAEGQPTEESVLDEIGQMIDMIYSREETARHICRKLYRFFVYYDINETLDDTIIAEMAATFISNDFKIQPVLEQLFQSEHFYEAVSGTADDKFGGIIKSPLDLTLGALKFFNVSLPSYTMDNENFYGMTGNLLAHMKNQGFNFYEPFEVAGYVAYHQYPVYNRNWISTNYLTRRYDYIRQLINQKEGLPNVDVLSFVKSEFNTAASDAKKLLITIAPYIFPFADNLDFEADSGDLTKERLRYFLQIFIQYTDYHNTAEVEQACADWASLYADPTKYLEAGEYIRRLFNTMLQSPEYQLF